MIHHLLEASGAMLGIAITLGLFAINIFSLFRGRRIFRSPRSWRMR